MREQYANSYHIKKATDIFDWESALNSSDANNKVSVINSTIINIATNFISNEATTCDDRDLTLMNSFIKNLITAKDKLCKKFVGKDDNMHIFVILKP